MTYPYLLKGVAVEYRDQVWATDITYIRLGTGFVYLLVIMGFASKVLKIRYLSQKSVEDAETRTK